MRGMTPRLVHLPARSRLAVDGVGAPEDAAFTRAVRALYAVRHALGDAADVPLEGSYAQDGDPARFDLDAPAGWHWRLAVPAPEGAAADAVAAAAERFGAPVVLADEPAREWAELLHRGPYADEGPSLATLYAHVAARGRRPDGPHTEVYLTDPGKVAPGDLRTLLRVPVGEA